MLPPDDTVHRRDALIASGLLAGIAVLWLVLRLWWQGAFILCAAGALFVLGRRVGSKPEVSMETADPVPADKPIPRTVGPGKGRKRRR